MRLEPTTVFDRAGPAAAAAVALLWLLMAAAQAQKAASAPSGPAPYGASFKFTERSGAELYANVCRACHMADGEGAAGAGAYPRLAGDKALAAGGYVIHVVVDGRRAMPPFGGMMDDDQVAAVVNYVRTHFGNDYRGAVTSRDVEAARR